jgi:hypothetical protein
MLGKIIGGLVGAKLSKGASGVNEPGGMVMGAVAVAVARRFGIPGMIAAAAGGYALKRYQERRRVVPASDSSV